MVSGVVCLLLGFNFGETSCACGRTPPRISCTKTLHLGTDAKTIALVVVGGVLLVVAGVYETYTTRSPVLPPRLFQVGNS